MDFYSFDDDYLQRLRSADPAIERHFTSYFSKLILIKLRSRLRSPEAIEDVRQETFLRVFRAVRANEVRSGERLGSYVNSVCNFVLLEHYRSGNREDTLDDQVREPADQTVNLEGALVTSEKGRQVRAVLEQLEPKDRDLLKALFLDEVEKDTICRRFGVDRDYLRVLLYRAKAQFRSRYQKIH